MLGRGCGCLPLHSFCQYPDTTGPVCRSRENVLLTSLEWLLNEIAVVRSEAKVINNRRIGNSILSATQYHNNAEFSTHAPEHSRHFIPVMMVVPLTAREQDMLERLLADIHGREDQVD